MSIFNWFSKNKPKEEKKKIMAEQLQKTDAQVNAGSEEIRQEIEHTSVKIEDLQTIA